MTVNDFLINESVSLLFIGNGLGYLIPPMIVTGPENAFNQSEFSNNLTHWNEDEFRQEFSLILTGLLKFSRGLSQSVKFLKAKFKIKSYFYMDLHLVSLLLSQEQKK